MIHPQCFKPFFNFVSSLCVFLPNFNVFINDPSLDI
jgi:hypothetical protein